MQKKSTALWLTKTAVGIALILVAQLIGKMIPAIAVIAGPFSVSQLITGTLVNLILIIITLNVGLGSGTTVGILSSILATLIGIGPIFPIITPLIAMSNVILVVIYYCFTKSRKTQNGARTKSLKNLYFYITIVVAAFIKCGFLWLTVPLVLNYVTSIQSAQRTMLTVMFSWPQAITALCGGILAVIIYPLLQNALSKNTN